MIHCGRSLITTDLRAISHILSHAYDYPKPDFVRDSLATMGAGQEGLLTVEGDVHRRQRRILVSPFFQVGVQSRLGAGKMRNEMDAEHSGLV